MFLWFIVMALCVFADQLTKYIAVMFLRPVDTVPIISDVLHLTYSENPGAAFGILKDDRWVFMSISTVAIVAMLFVLIKFRPQDKLECLAISLIVGGGIGNMIDRLILGYVVDFVDFRLINFAIFNLADSCVCVGAGLLVVYAIRSMIAETKKEKVAAALEAEDAQAENDVEGSSENDDAEQ